MPNSEPPLSALEAAERLGITRRAVIGLIERGTLPAHKLAGRTGSYVIQKTDVEQLVSTRTGGDE